jgi:hypothetical protein
MTRTGFRNIMVRYFGPDAHLVYDEAIKVMKEWSVDPNFIEEHVDDLRKHGLEFPVEHVVFCRK